MKIQQYKIYNESELNLINDSLQKKLAPLSQNWFSDNDFTVQVLNSFTGDEGTKLLSAFNHKPDLFYEKNNILLSLSSQHKQYLLAELLQSPVNNIELSCPASQQIVEKFITRVAESLGENRSNNSENQKENYSAKAGSGCLFLKISKGQWIIQCLLTPSIIADALPARKNKQAASLEKINPISLVAEKTTHVYADLGVAQLNIQQLQQLVIGDVVQLGTSFTDKARIYSDAGDYLFEGLLVKSAGRKAISVESSGSAGN